MSKHKKPEGPLPTPESLGLPLVGVESHAHLNSRQYDQDRDEVLQRARRSGVARIANVFLSPEAWETGRAFFAGHPEVFFLLGIHPTEAANCDAATLERMRQIFTQDTRVRALGEIGLDYYWKDCPPEVQRKAFVSQLQLAEELDLPVVVHSRDAFEDTFGLLTEQGFAGKALLWHCFGGDADQARRIVAAGWHVSIPGPITFPSNHVLREAVKEIPLNRLMVETDCPYLSPVPYRGKRNEPAYLAFTITALAQTLDMDRDEIWGICGKNALGFFRL